MKTVRARKVSGTLDASVVWYQWLGSYFGRGMSHSRPAKCRCRVAKRIPRLSYRANICNEHDTVRGQRRQPAHSKPMHMYRRRIVCSATIIYWHVRSRFNDTLDHTCDMYRCWPSVVLGRLVLPVVNTGENSKKGNRTSSHPFLKCGNIHYAGSTVWWLWSDRHIHDRGSPDQSATT